MSDFDPKAYLAKKKSFDARAYLAKKKSAPVVQITADDPPSWQERETIADPSLTPEQSAVERLGGRSAATVFGAANGATAGFADEIVGALDVPVEKGKQVLRALGVIDPEERVSDEINTPGAIVNGRITEAPKFVPDSGPIEPTAGEIYRKGRDSVRHLDDASDQIHPGYHFAGEMAGIVAAPTGKIKAVAGVGKAANIGRGALQGAKLGAMFGAGNSRADLTKGDVGQFVGDIEDSATVGGLIGGVGGYVSSAIRARQAKAAADALSAQEKLAQKAAASARGKLGAETSAGFRTLEQLERAISDPNVDAAVAAEARAFLQSSEGIALRNQVLSNATVRGQDQLGRIADAQRGFGEASANTSPEAISNATENYLSKSTLKEDVWPRVKRYLSRKFTGVIADSAGGGDVGQVASTIVGAQMGDPGTALANLLRNARFRHKAAGAIAGTLEAGLTKDAAASGGELPQKLDGYLQNPKIMQSKYGPGLQAASEKGGKALAIEHYLNSQRDPEYRALLADDTD